MWTTGKFWQECMLLGIGDALECQEFQSNYLYECLSWLPDNPIYGSTELMGYGTQGEELWGSAN
jgi:hypothetical protein